MARDSAKARPSTLVGTTRLRELLRPYASSGAEWFIRAACSLLPASEVPALTVIVWLNGQELARWPLHAMTYGSLVSQLIEQTAHLPSRTPATLALVKSLVQRLIGELVNSHFLPEHKNC